MTENTSVLVVGTGSEEDSLLRNQIGDLVEIIEMVPDPDKGLELARARSPNIVLLYLDHQPQKILTISKELGFMNGCLPMIVSRDRDPERILQAMRSGAKEFAFLQEGNDDVRRAIRELSHTPSHLSAAPSSAAKVISVFG